MKVTATHWVNHNGTWYHAGETYDDGKPEVVTPTKEEPEETAPQTTEQPKRSRKRTSKES